MLIPGLGSEPGFDAIDPASQQEDISMRNQRFTLVRLFHLHMTRLTRAFSVSFTTAAFDRSSIRLFEASPYRAGSEGPEYRSNRER